MYMRVSNHHDLITILGDDVMSGEWEDSKQNEMFSARELSSEELKEVIYNKCDMHCIVAHITLVETLQV